MLNILTDTSNEAVVNSMLILAVIRIYLEVMGFDLLALPLSKAMAKTLGEDSVKRWHKSGLILSIGVVILFAPSVILS